MKSRLVRLIWLHDILFKNSSTIGIRQWTWVSYIDAQKYYHNGLSTVYEWETVPILIGLTFAYHVNLVTYAIQD